MNSAKIRKAVSLFLVSIFLAVTPQVNAIVDQPELTEHISPDPITQNFTKSVKIDITGMQYEDYKKNMGFRFYNRSE
jgi:hypothetical protein